jgi:hypothetical protein
MQLVNGKSALQGADFSNLLQPVLKPGKKYSETNKVKEYFR